MSLQDLNEKLHGRELHLDRAREHTTYEPDQEDVSDAPVISQFQKKEEWQKPATPSQEELLLDLEKQKRRRKIALVVGGIAGLILLGGLIFKIRAMLFDEERVTLEISGPKNVASAETVTYAISYANSNLASLDDAVLILSYPESFHPEADGRMKITGLRAEIPLGKIGANAHGKTSVSGKFFGAKGELAFLRGTLRFARGNLSDTLEKTTQFGLNVASSPLSLEITAPLELASGQETVYVVDYGNLSDMPFSNLRVKLDYPENFSFVSADPRPSEGDGVWYIGNLAGNAGNKIVIRGVLSGTRDEIKKVRGMIGYLQGDGNFVSYNANERQTRMIASPLTIYQTVNGSATSVNAGPGDELRYSIRYRNDGAIGVRDAIVTLELDSAQLDFSRLSLQKGAYDAARKMIVWKASDVPALARIEPGQGGEVAFSIPIFDSIVLRDGEKNLSVRSIAKIDSPDIPTPIGANKVIGSNTLFVKISALAAIDLKGFYKDEAFPNAGPIPPVVGQETTYTLHLGLGSASNDLTVAKASVALPTGVVYKGKSLPGNETVAFNDRTNELTWEVGTLAPGAKREIIFQIGVTPAPSQAGKEVTLVNGVIFTAEDSFTGQSVRVEKGAKTNFLPEDASVGMSGSQVQAASQ